MAFYHISPRVFASSSFFIRGNKLNLITSSQKGVDVKEDLTLYLTVPLCAVNSIFEENGICFSSPHRWHDPFEYLFYNDKATAGGKACSIACICLSHERSESEESMWSIRTASSSIPQSVRLSINAKEFIEQLSNCNPDYTFYLSEIDYSQTRKDIINKYKKIKEKEFRYDTAEDYISHMSLKRQAFVYEHEVRLFAVKDEDIAFDENKLHKLNISNGNKFVRTITLPPLKPNGVLDTEAKHNAYRTELDDIKKTIEPDLREVGYTGKIQQSRLYDIHETNIYK